MLLSRGAFAAGPPPATLELTSHGVYDTPKCEVLLSQRFDGYDGISVAVHTDKAGGGSIIGPMRVAASLGCKLNADLAPQLLQRAVGLVELVLLVDLPLPSEVM